MTENKDRYDNPEWNNSADNPPQWRNPFGDPGADYVPLKFTSDFVPSGEVVDPQVDANREDRYTEQIKQFAYEMESIVALVERMPLSKLIDMEDDMAENYIDAETNERGIEGNIKSTIEGKELFCAICVNDPVCVSGSKNSFIYISIPYDNGTVIAQAYNNASYIVSFYQPGDSDTEIEAEYNHFFNRDGRGYSSKDIDGEVFINNRISPEDCEWVGYQLLRFNRILSSFGNPPLAENETPEMRWGMKG
ncbi:hypothetical protein HGB07_01235 [Candidatus Roizmanbacteria bacterium]|nr:hypothetical protein [Candidatus Roizmanbacteria bacterium]